MLLKLTTINLLRKKATKKIKNKLLNNKKKSKTMARIIAKYLKQRRSRKAKNQRRLKSRQNRLTMMRNRALDLSEMTSLLKRAVKILRKTDQLPMLILLSIIQTLKNSRNNTPACILISRILPDLCQKNRRESTKRKRSNYLKRKSNKRERMLRSSKLPLLVIKKLPKNQNQN